MKASLYVFLLFNFGCSSPHRQEDAKQLPIVRFKQRKSHDFLHVLDPSIGYQKRLVDTTARRIEKIDFKSVVFMPSGAHLAMENRFGIITQRLSVEIQDLALKTEDNIIEIIRWDFETAQASKSFYDVYRWTYNNEKTFMLQEMLLLDKEVYFFNLRSKQRDNAPYIRLGRLHELTDRIREWLFFNCELEVDGAIYKN